MGPGKAKLPVEAKDSRDIPQVKGHRVKNNKTSEVV